MEFVGNDLKSLGTDVELLGQLPLELKIREQTDSGNPSVIAEPDGALKKEIAAVECFTGGLLKHVRERIHAAG